jgi:hypothetical protein
MRISQVVEEVERVVWKKVGNSYVFKGPDVFASLKPENNVWKMLIVIDKQRYTGERPTLEEAFKVTDKLIFQKAKQAWLNSDCKAVIAPWQGDLDI